MTTQNEIIKLSSLIDKYPQVARELLGTRTTKKVPRQRRTKPNNSLPEEVDYSEEKQRFKDGKYYHVLTCADCGKLNRTYLKKQLTPYKINHWKCLPCRRKVKAERRERKEQKEKTIWGRE